MELARKLFKNKRLQYSSVPFTGRLDRIFPVSYLEAGDPGGAIDHIELAGLELKCASQRIRIT